GDLCKMINQMKKISVVALSDDIDFLMRDLMWLSSVQIEKKNSDKDAFLHPLNFSEEKASLELKKTKLSSAIKFLSPYRKTEKKLFSARRIVKCEDIDALSYDSDAIGYAENAVKISARISSVDDEINKKEDLLKNLSVWQEHDLPLSFSGTAKTFSCIGSFPASADIDAIRLRIEELTSSQSEICIVNSDASAKYVFVICHKAFENELLSLINSLGFTRASFESGTGTAIEEIKKTEAQISELRDEKGRLFEEAKSLAAFIPDMETSYDAVSSSLARTLAKEKLCATSRTIHLSGFVPAKRTERVEKTLSRYVCSYEFSDPLPEDDTPILLSNNAFADPFESLIGLYSYPKYGTFDPALIMGIFYSLFFGMMSADVGYGAVIVIGCILALKLMKPGLGMSRFLKMFMISGVSCMIMGVLFGGWFGDLPKQFAENILGINGFNGPWYLLNPLEEPMIFFVLSLALGFIHLCVGMGIKMVQLIKNGEIFAAIFDIGSWYVVYLGIALLALLKFPWVLVVGLLMIICTHGRHQKNPIMKFFSGLLGLYDIVSFMSDILSYSRILALGLSSAVIASVFNILATLGGTSPITIILFPLVFILGHGLNLLLSLLSSFIHSSRLQYVEFFGKFYEDGGKAFSPLRPELKYVDVAPTENTK
ncbi:MAG: V-type ATP synthase subunit I, partial [Eubacteriales bacterium]